MEIAGVLRLAQLASWSTRWSQMAVDGVLHGCQSQTYNIWLVASLMGQDDLMGQDEVRQATSLH